MHYGQRLHNITPSVTFTLNMSTEMLTIVLLKSSRREHNISDSVYKTFRHIRTYDIVKKKNVI